MVRTLQISGSIKNFISQNLIEKCCLKPITVEVKLAQELFGGHTTTLKARNIYNVNIRLVNNSFENYFDWIELRQNCGNLSRCQEPSVLTALSQKGVTLSDLCEENVDEVEILLGADHPYILISTLQLIIC